MPQIIPVIVYYAAEYFGVTTMVAFFAAAAASYAVGDYQARRAARHARDAYNASITDRLVMQATTDGARSRVYGQVRNVDGLIFKATHGDKSQFYTLVIALAGHQVQEIGQVYFGDVPVTIDVDGWVRTAPFMRSERVVGGASMMLLNGAGSVTVANTPIAGTANVTYSLGGSLGTDSTAGTINGNTISVSGLSGVSGLANVSYEYTRELPKARVWKYLGTPTQNISNDLLLSRFSSMVTANDRFAGIACLVVELEYNEDAYPNGIPGISAVIKGATVLDPRTNTTAWSENPALISRDWALYANGGAMVPSELVGQTINSAANACDVLTNFNVGGIVETRPLYQCGIVCKLDASPQQWMDEIVASMAGSWGFAGGKLSMRSGTWRSPVATITEDWLSGVESLKLDDLPPRESLVNEYRATIADAEQNYVVLPAPTVRSSAYVAIDGQPLPRETALDGVTHSAHAQHIAGVIMRDSRNGFIEVPCNMRAWSLELFDVVTVNLPRYGENTTREVVGWRWSMQGGVVLTLRKTQATDFDPKPSFDAPVITQNTNLPLPWIVPSVSGLSVVSNTTALQDGTLQTRAQASWMLTSSESVRQSGKTEIQYAELGATLPVGDWPSFICEGGATSGIILGLRAGQHYAFRARFINTLGVRSNWCPAVIHRISGLITGASIKANVNDFSGTVNYGEAWVHAIESPGVAVNAPGIVVINGVKVSVPNGPLYTSQGPQRGWIMLDTAGNTFSPSRPYAFVRKQSGQWQYDSDTGWVNFTPSATRWLIGNLETGNADVNTAPGIISAAIWPQALHPETLVGLGDTASWTAVAGRPSLFRVASRGLWSTTHPIETGLYNGETGQVLFGAARSYLMVRIRRSDGAITYQQIYDVYGNGETAAGRNAATMAADLNATGNDSVVVVYSDNEPHDNRLTSGLDTAMYRCGASRSVFGSPQFMFRSAYILVGIGGCGEGNGFEAYQGAIDGDTNAWCDVAFTLQNGQLIISGTSATPRTLADYSYVGDLNATYGATAGTNIYDSNGRITTDNRLLGNIVNATTWVVGSTGSQPGFPINGQGAENSIILTDAPDRITRPVWDMVAGAGGTVAGQDDGGWNTDWFNVDHTKMYRFSVWVRRDPAESSGFFYLGVGGNSVNDIGGVANGNPYFYASGRGALPGNWQWCLMVGYVFPSSYGGPQLNLSGLYNGATGLKMANGTDYRWVVSQTTSDHRAYQYYTNAGARQQFWGPRVDLCDGNEPSLTDLLSVTAVSALNPITTGNVGSIVGPGAMGTGQLANNAATEFNSTTQATRTCKLRSDTGASITPPYEAGGSSMEVDVLTLSYMNNTGAAVSMEVTGSFVCKLSHTSGTSGSSYGFIRTRLSATISTTEYGESSTQPMASDAGLTDGLIFSRSPALQLVSVPNGSTLNMAIKLSLQWKSGTPANVGDLIAAFNDLTIRYAALKR